MGLERQRQYRRSVELDRRPLVGPDRALDRSNGVDGYAMAALLVALAIMSLVWTMAIPAWRTMVQREKEAELIFRARQYAHAITLYQRRFANAFPPSVDVLVQQKFLRKKYKDPITGQDFRVLSPAELQTIPGFGIQTGPAGSRGPQPGTGLGGSGGGVRQPGFGSSRTGPGASGSGTAGPESTGPGLQSRPGSTPGTSPSGPFGQTGREGNLGGVAAVVSRSSARSIRIFKNRQQYNQWIVTVEDVSRRIGPQPVQPGQQQPGRPGMPTTPGSTTPGRPGGGFPSTRPPGD
jgi:type II secretory pathway pseudopilin PulG